MNFPSKQELQQIGLNHLSDIDFGDFTDFYKVNSKKRKNINNSSGKTRKNNQKNKDHQKNRAIEEHGKQPAGKKDYDRGRLQNTF